MASRNNSFDESDFTRVISAALNQLSELDNSMKLREDAIRNGKAIVENWTPPSDEQIDKIFNRMKDELIDVF